jgi:HEAT repeat protein
VAPFVVKEAASMGLFDLFKSKGDARAEKPKANPAAKWANVAADKRAQNYDRQEAIAALSAMGTAEAAAALLRRFTFHMDPSITDQDEKDAAFNGVVRAGREAIEPIRAFVAKAESLSWPMKVMKEISSGEEELVDELVLWLSKWDTEYAKFIDPKIQLLAALEEHKSPHIRAEAERFLLDVNESARFHAVGATLAQDDPEAIPALLDCLVDEESVRVKHRLVDGFIAREWAVPEEKREAVRKALPSGATIDAAGQMKKRA